MSDSSHEARPVVAYRRPCPRGSLQGPLYYGQRGVEVAGRRERVVGRPWSPVMPQAQAGWSPTTALEARRAVSSTSHPVVVSWLI